MSKVNNNFRSFIKNVIELMGKPVMSVLPGQLSFFLLLSIIPILLIISLASSFLSIPTDSLANLISNGFPAGTGSLIIPLLKEKTLDYSTIFLMVSALLLVSKGTRSIMRVASIIYGSQDKNTIREIIKSFIMAIILILLVAFIIIIPIFSTKVLNILHNFKIISSLTDNIIFVYNILKWPISIFIIYINIKFIYMISPNKKISAKSVNKGAIFTTILWSILTSLYSFYISNISSYDTFYGSASKIIVLMLWIYLISYIFVLGMSINANSNIEY